MAKFDKAFGFAIGEQAAEGTVDPTIAALAGSIGLADGIVLGSRGAGVAGSGITFGTARAFSEKARNPGGTGGTPAHTSFLREDIATLSFAWPFGGSLITADGTPADAEFQHSAGNNNGIDTLLESCGIGGAAWGSGVGWEHTPAALQLASAKLWVGAGADSFAYVLRDLRGSLSVVYTAGQEPLATWTGVGVIDAASAVATLPTFNYGVQGTGSVPSVKSAGFSYGGISQGFRDLTVTINNGLSVEGDSNAGTGEVIEAAPREVSFTGTLYADDSNVDIFREDLLGNNANPLTWTLGTPVVSTEVMEAHRWVGLNMEVRSLGPAELGSRQGYTLEAVPTSSGTDDEVSLIFL